MTRTDGWLRCRKENGPAASEPCCRSEWLLHGRDPHGSNRIQGRGASVARDGGLPSDLLKVLTAASDYLKRKKSGGAMT